MTARIGLGVGRAEVRAVLLRDGAIAWRAARAVVDSEPLADVIAELLTGAPIRRLFRPAVVAAIGPATSQVKRLTGLPTVSEQAVVSQLLRANTGRFFLHSDASLAAPVAYRSNGSWWGAVVHDQTIESIQEACERARLRFEGCIPTSAALAHMITDGSVEWRDGDLRTTVTVARRIWTDIRRDHEGASPVELIPALARTGADAARYADAFVAACSTRESPLFLRPAHRRGSLPARSRILALTAAVFLAFLAALSARGLAAARQVSKDGARLASLRSTSAEWAPVGQQLREASGGLNQVARFYATRRSAVQLLDAISRALPDSTAIVTLRVDSAGGSMTLVSTSAASIVPSLAGLTLIEQPRIVGAVTRESVGGARVQRIAIRFRFPSARPAPSEPAP
jgi:hypothetical protein